MTQRLKRIFVMAFDQKRNDIDSTFWQKDEPLSGDSQKMLDNVYGRFLAEVYFVLVGSSHFKRAIQAAQNISASSHILKFENLDPISDNAWDVLLSENPNVKKSTDKEMFERHESRYLLLTEGKNLLRFIKSMADRIEMGQNVLLVSNTLFVESAMAQTEEKFRLKYLESGDVVVFLFEENKKFVGLEILTCSVNR